MASFLFVPFSVPGHVHPMLPVLAELADRGHSVRAFVAPRFGADVRAAGARPVLLRAVPDVYVPERIVGRPALRFVAGRLLRPVANRRAAAALRAELRRERADVMVTDPMIGWADRVADRLSLRTALFSTTFAANDDVHVELAHIYGRRWQWPGRIRRLQRLRPMVRRYLRRDRPILVHAIPSLQPRPETLGDAASLVGPLRRQARRCRTAVAIPDGGPVLFVSPGTVFARDRSFFTAIVEAFGGTEWWVLLATGHADPGALGDLPPNVVAHRYLPQPALLARSTVFLTHAGMNSALEGLSAGVPMAFAPRSSEQRFIADRLTALGVGLPVDVRRWARQRLFDVVSGLAADPAVLRATARWRDRLATPRGAAVAADLLTVWAQRSDKVSSACPTVGGPQR